MINGDISNEVPRRLMVTFDVVTTDVETIKRTFFRDKVLTRRVFEPVTLNRLWHYTSRVPLRLELVSFGVDESTARERLEELDRKGLNPFNYSSAYAGVVELVRELPYRPDVLGVLDVPEHQLMYGSRGIGMEHLDRGL